jgi:hypothetical protein
LGVTLDRYVYERAGSILQAAHVAAHLSVWVEAAHRKGKFPTTEEFAVFAGKSERTAWRYRAAIHRVFPGDEMQAVVMGAASRLRDGQDPLRVEVPPELLRRSA